MRVFTIFTERSYIPHRFDTEAEARAWASVAKLGEQVGGWEIVAMTEAEAEGYRLTEPAEQEVEA